MYELSSGSITVLYVFTIPLKLLENKPKQTKKPLITQQQQQKS